MKQRNFFTTIVLLFLLLASSNVYANEYIPVADGDYKAAQNTGVTLGGENVDYQEDLLYLGKDGTVNSWITDEMFKNKIYANFDEFDTYFKAVSTEAEYAAVLTKAYKERVPYVMIKTSKDFTTLSDIDLLDKIVRGVGYIATSGWTLSADDTKYRIIYIAYGEKINFVEAKDEYTRLLVNYLNENFTTDLEKIVALYKTINDHVEYDYSSLSVFGNNYNQYMSTAVVNKKAVCAGYAQFFQQVAQALGFEVFNVNGMANGVSGTEAHAWNLIKLDGKYYAIDATFGDTSHNYAKYLLFNELEYNDRTREAKHNAWFPTTVEHYADRNQLEQLYNSIKAPSFQVGISTAKDYVLGKELSDAITAKEHEIINTNEWFNGMVSYRAFNKGKDTTIDHPEIPNVDSSNLAQFKTALNSLDYKHLDSTFPVIDAAYNQLSAKEQGKLSSEALTLFNKYKKIYDGILLFEQSLQGFTVIPQTDGVTEDFLGWSINLTGVLDSRDFNNVKLYDKWGVELPTAKQISTNGKAVEVYLPSNTTYEKGMAYYIKIQLPRVEDAIYKFNVN